MYQILLPMLIGHLYLSDIWLGMAPRMETKKTCLKIIGFCARNMITILDSTIDILEGSI